MKIERTEEGYRIETDAGDVVAHVYAQPNEPAEVVQQRAEVRAVTYSLIHEVNHNGD